MSVRPDVALDVPRTRHMSAGMSSYARELAQRLPRVAPDLRFAEYTHATSFGREEQIALPLRILRERPRLTHFLSVYAPLAAPGRFAITIHDLIHLRYPQFFKASVGWYYRTVVRATCARAGCVITDDPRTIADLQRFLGVPPARVRVVPLGVDDAFLRDHEPEPAARPFFLYVGNHREHKDLPTLFAAWAALPPDCVADLYLTGPDDLSARMRLPERANGSIRFLGDVALERLARLYRAALALCHPALCEGYGLPLLEAVASGTPVFACRDAIPAVLDAYVDAFAPGDASALRALMEGVARTPDRRPGPQMFARTQTWDRCARATAEVYRELLAEVEGG